MSIGHIVNLKEENNQIIVLLGTGIECKLKGTFKLEEAREFIKNQMSYNITPANGQKLPEIEIINVWTTKGKPIYTKPKEKESCIIETSATDCNFL